MSGLLKRPNPFWLVLLCIIATLSLQKLSRNNLTDKNAIPSDDNVKRSLSINLGNGECEWQLPKDLNHDNPVFSTVLAGYPGSNKRSAFMQLEGITELTTGDDFNLRADAQNKRFAFMKTSYPSHEGIWSWGHKMDQVILLVRNPRWALVSYMNLLYEINYASQWSEAYARHDYVYTVRPPVSEWLTWRELRFDAEIAWWGWFIDFWMEGGLMRDVFTHEKTTPGIFAKFQLHQVYSEAELAAEQAELGDNFQDFYDSHCTNDIESCTPAAIASFEKMVKEATGPNEVDKYAATLEGQEGLTLIENEARACVWKELIVHKKGNIPTFDDREGPPLEQFGFTVTQMERILEELYRLRNKYSASPWDGNLLAQDLVDYLETYIVDNLEELTAMNEFIDLVS
jgi:hypothetical protein